MQKQVANVNKVRSKDGRAFQRVRSNPIRPVSPPIPETSQVKLTDDTNHEESNKSDFMDELVGIFTNPWVIAWIVAGLLTMLIPRIIWHSKKSDYFDAYGSAIYAQDYYEEQKRYYEQGNNKYYGYNENGNQYKHLTCHWYNWLSCRKKQYYYATYEERANGEIVTKLPDWFFFFGGETQEMEQWKNEMNGEEREERGIKDVNETGFNFVYTLTIWIFLAKLVYGVVVIGKGQAVSSLLIVLGFSFLMGLSNLIMSVQGAISSEREALENSYYGWYGQKAVLLAYTDMWVMFFSGCFIVALIAKMFLESEKSKKHVNTSTVGDYHAPENVEMT